MKHRPPEPPKEEGIWKKTYRTNAMYETIDAQRTQGVCVGGGGGRLLVSLEPISTDKKTKQKRKKKKKKTVRKDFFKLDSAQRCHHLG